MLKKVRGFESRNFVCEILGFVFILFIVFCHCRVWGKWRSFLYNNADLGKDRGKQYDDGDHSVFSFHCEVVVLFCFLF